MGEETRKSPDKPHREAQPDAMRQKQSPEWMMQQKRASKWMMLQKQPKKWMRRLAVLAAVFAVTAASFLAGASYRSRMAHTTQTTAAAVQESTVRITTDGESPEPAGPKNEGQYGPATEAGEQSASSGTGAAEEQFGSSGAEVDGEQFTLSEADILKKLGAGISIGNGLDAVGRDYAYKLSGVYDYETYYGNVPVTRKVFRALREAGFQTVRIPVSWGEHQDENGIIDAAWMDRVQEVVDAALTEDLYVILNTHHEDWLIPTFQDQETVKARLCGIWGQIAERFAEYDERLLFEGMNEPRLRGTEYEWSAGTEESREVVNRLNAAFVETVRTSGGNNAARYLLITGYCAAYLTEALSALAIPASERLIVSVHAYLPHAFTGSAGGNEIWDTEKAGYTEDIKQLRTDLQTLFLQRGIPVVLTEYGCKEKASEEERLAWAKYFLTAFTEIGIPCIWWDNGGDYRIIDRRNGEITAQELTAVLIEKGSGAQ